MGKPHCKWENKRVRTPTVLQMEAVECGAAALAMVLGYHGRIAPLEELRLECSVSRDGIKASNILKAARKYGLTAQGLKKEPEGLGEVPLPAIVFWNLNHFVVFEGIKGKKVYINDPAMGPRVISKEDFDQSFSGVVLTFEPGPQFKKGGVKRSLFQALRERLTGSRLALTYVVLAGLFLVIPGLVIPIFSKIFVNNILIEEMHSWIKPLLIGMFLTAFLRGSLTWLQQYFLLRFETKLAVTTSARFFQHIFMLPVEFFTQRYGGEIGFRVQLNDKVAQLLSGQLATNVINVVMMIFYAVVMFKYDVLMTAVGCFAALLNLLALQLVSRKRVDLNQKMLQEQGKLVGTSMRGLQMIETLKGTSSESDFYAQWAGYLAKLFNAQQGLGFSTQLLTSIPTLLSNLTNVVILGLGGLRVMTGHLSMGELVAFQSLMASFMVPVTGLVNIGSLIQEAHGDMNRLDDVFHYAVDKQFSSNPEEDKDHAAPAKLSGRLELRNISFGYNRLAAPLIENFSLALQPGSRVALVGGSGSGKSTIAKLVTGLYEVWGGEILYDGKPRGAIPRTLINNSLALVDQDIFLFGGTIRDNLTVWDSTVSDSDMTQAAKDACIHEDLVARPEGYYAKVDEGGSNFSGGQRQRLEIARALTGNPTLLVLDEATSALDSVTEEIIDDNLRRRGLACLIIAHRLSTIRDSDEIIVLEGGKVVQRGTHDELRRLGGEYVKLIHTE